MSEERQDIQNMSVVGHKVWVHMQDKGPYNKRAFARFLKRKGVLSTTHQSISGWLRKDNPPAYFINAVVDGLELDEDEKAELYRLYFEGSGFRRDRSLDPVPEEPGLTKENIEKLEARKRELREQDSIDPREINPQSGDTL